MSKQRSQSSFNPTSWFHRKAQLQTLLGNCGDDEGEGLALDRILYSQSVIGETHKVTEIDNLRFSDKDLSSFGPLADAQFGTVELVNCRLDGRVYVRKRVSKKFALKNREQCSPKYERHILLQTLKSQPRSSSSWTPHMLCAYQCSSFLNIVMEYAAGGSLWDILESSEDGRLAASDLAWWAPQCVSAIDWLHSRAGFAHRDIKPHNFVVRPGQSPQLLLIDFGTAAPLLKPRADGVQLVPRSHCLVPCGTCDYISPEILQAHEEALVALEMSEDEHNVDDTKGEAQNDQKMKNERRILQDDAGYGRETDWWSLGAMLYELAFGVAPFFANDIRQTYARIMNHESNLGFDRKVLVPSTLISLIKGLLIYHENRLGRYSTDELRNHAYFKDVNWTNLRSRPPPPDLLLPEFTYSTPLIPPEPEDDRSESSTDTSRPFAFSALFQSSVTSKPDASSFRPIECDPTCTPSFGRHSLSRGGHPSSAQRSVVSFIGFSWGPPTDAFDDATRIVPAELAAAQPGLVAPAAPKDDIATVQYPPITPKRPSEGGVPPSTVRVTSVRRSVQSRPVSDREAMRVLVNCVGQSARKRVVESGKKPKVLLPQFGFGPPPPPAISAAALRDGLDKGCQRASSLPRSSPKLSAASAVRKELRFDDSAPHIMPNLSYTNTFTATLSNSGMSASVIPYIPPPYSASDSGTMSETDGPPSPSPSPRPGSAMSMLSMSRRSTTPTISSTFLTGGSLRSSSVTHELRLRPRAGSLGSLSGGRNANVRRDSEEMKEMGMARRARFVSSPGSSPERAKEHVPATPYPKVQPTDEKEKVPRRAQFADSPETSEEDIIKKRVPATPHPRTGRNLAREQERETQPTARFLDSPPGSPVAVGLPVASTPHPNGHAHARRTTRPPLETRPSIVTSTPARPNMRRSKTAFGESSDEDDDLTIRPQPPSTRRLDPDECVQEDRNESHVHEEEDTESLPDYDTLHPQPDPQRCRNPSPPSFLDDDLSERNERAQWDTYELDMFDEMESRYKLLLADIANISLHIDELSSRVNDAHP